VQQRARDLRDEQARHLLRPALHGHTASLVVSYC
jgi:hypothetical protein